ncbi:MAG: hypothetical protein F4X19_07295 [Acidobacteria bacterium]|nr:hypothetical protein [Acidobacteriota bacterium]
MATTAFDTLKVSQDLKAAGFNEVQAGAIVRSMAGAFQDRMIAARTDIDKLRAFTVSEFAAVRVEIDSLRASTTADIANLKAEIFRALWIQGAGIFGIHLAIGGLLFAAIRFLN